MRSPVRDLVRVRVRMRVRVRVRVRRLGLGWSLRDHRSHSLTTRTR